MADFLVPTNLLLALIFFSIFRFENQRWAKQINEGRTGSSSTASAFVTLTSVAALLFGLGVLGTLVWQAGWQIALVTTVVVAIAAGLASILISIATRGDSFVFQLLATVLLWPLAAYVGLLINQTYFSA